VKSGARLIFLAFLALAVTLAWPVAAQTSQEEVKATFVYRFVSFVSWPPSTGANTVRLCVIGSAPFARTLRRVASGQRADGRPFDVRAVSGGADLRTCHAVYVVGERTEATLRAARQLPVLTITDGGGDRGMIHFVVVDDRVRFHIDDASAAESRLGIDPRLLDLAVSVRRREAH
jgi:hypothetical protein